MAENNLSGPMPDSKPTLLYVPGMDGTGRLLWRQNALASAYDILSMSYPQDREKTYVELAAEAAARLSEKTRGKPAVVLAESFGGAVGLLLALEHPELVERLVLVNTFAYFPERLKIRTGAIAARWFSEYLPGFVVKWVGGKVLFAPDLPREIRREFQARVADVPMGAVGRRVRMLARLDLRSRLGEIQTPTLVFISPNDRVVRPRAGLELARQLPRAKILEQPAGHAALFHPAVDVLAWLTEKSNWC